MDIVERLRFSDNDTEWVEDLDTLERKQVPTLAWEAAQEIETLRREVAGLRQALSLSDGMTAEDDKRFNRQWDAGEK